MLALTNTLIDFLSQFCTQLYIVMPFLKCMSINICDDVKNQDRGLLGDLITSPFDFAGCLSKCVSIQYSLSHKYLTKVFLFQPISPLEFPGCSVDCAKETNSGENRGLLGDLITSPFDFAGCLSKCVSIRYSLSHKYLTKVFLF